MVKAFCDKCGKEMNGDKPSTHIHGYGYKDLCDECRTLFGRLCCDFMGNK